MFIQFSGLCNGRKEEDARKKLLIPEIEKEGTSMTNGQQTCVSIMEEKEEKKENMRNNMVKDTMVKEGEGGSVTTLLLAGNDEKNGNETGN